MEITLTVPDESLRATVESIAYDLLFDDRRNLRLLIERTVMQLLETTYKEAFDEAVEQALEEIRNSHLILKGNNK